MKIFFFKKYLLYSTSSSVVAIPIYTSEISQPEIRKITGVFAVIGISLGGCLSMIFGKFVEK